MGIIVGSILGDCGRSVERRLVTLFDIFFVSLSRCLYFLPRVCVHFDLTSANTRISGHLHQTASHADFPICWIGCQPRLTLNKKCLLIEQDTAISTGSHETEVRARVCVCLGFSLLLEIG